MYLTVEKEAFEHNPICSSSMSSGYDVTGSKCVVASRGITVVNLRSYHKCMHTTTLQSTGATSLLLLRPTLPLSLPLCLTLVLRHHLLVLLHKPRIDRRHARNTLLALGLRLCLSRILLSSSS